jgi:hypothetical protein
LEKYNPLKGNFDFLGKNVTETFLPTRAAVIVTRAAHFKGTWYSSALYRLPSPQKRSGVGGNEGDGM